MSSNIGVVSEFLLYLSAKKDQSWCLLSNDSFTLSVVVALQLRRRLCEAAERIVLEAIGLKSFAIQL